MPFEPTPAFLAWLAEVVDLAQRLYGRTVLETTEELVAGFTAGDTPAEFVAGVFAPE